MKPLGCVSTAGTLHLFTGTAPNNPIFFVFTDKVTLGINKPIYQ